MLLAVSWEIRIRLMERQLERLFAKLSKVERGSMSGGADRLGKGSKDPKINLGSLK